VRFDHEGQGSVKHVGTDLKRQPKRIARAAPCARGWWPDDGPAQGAMN
jgi:hypothetical protein